MSTWIRLDQAMQMAAERGLITTHDGLLQHCRVRLRPLPPAIHGEDLEAYLDRVYSKKIEETREALLARDRRVADAATKGYVDANVLGGLSVRAAGQNMASALAGPHASIADALGVSGSGGSYARAQNEPTHYSIDEMHKRVERLWQVFMDDMQERSRG